MAMPRSTMKPKIATMMMQNRMPNSSAVTEKMKSVWPSGMMRLTVPSPGPLPNQPPRREGLRRLVDLEVVAGLRVHEAVDAARHVRQDLVGGRRGRTRRRRRARRPRSRAGRRGRTARPRPSVISTVWPRSGCSTSSPTTQASSSAREEMARHVAAARSLPRTARRRAPRRRASRIRTAGPRSPRS